LINEAKGQTIKLVFNVGKKLCFKSSEISSSVNPSLKPKAAKKTKIDSGVKTHWSRVVFTKTWNAVKSGND